MKNTGVFKRLLSIFIIFSILLLSGFLLYGYTEDAKKIIFSDKYHSERGGESPITNVLRAFASAQGDSEAALSPFSSIGYQVAEIISPSNNDYGIRVSWETNGVMYADYDSDTEIEISFKLNSLSQKEVSFDYNIYPGSAYEELYDSEDRGTVIFEAGETEKVLTIGINKLVNNPKVHGTASNPWEFWTGDRILYMNCRNIENALFENDKESTIITIIIKNDKDLTEVYESAVNEYFLSLDELENVKSFPDTPGKYENADIEMLLFNGKPISPDVRAMLDTNVFTHFNMPQGYLINEGAAGEVLFKVEKEYTWGSTGTAYTYYISLSEDENTRFSLSGCNESMGVPVGDIGLGTFYESNGIIKALGASFNYETVTGAVYTCFMDEDEVPIEMQMNFTDEVKPYIANVTVPNGSFFYGENIPITITYNEPVVLYDISICANGKTLYPMESADTISDRVSFLYEVDEKYEGTIELTNITGAADLSGKFQNESSDYTLTNSLLSVFDVRKAFSYLSQVSVDIEQRGNINAVGEITINLKGNFDFTNWLSHRISDGIVTSIKGKVIGEDGNAVDITFHINDGPIINNLKGSFTAPANLTEKEICYVSEILLDERGTGVFTPVYSLASKYEIPPIIYIDDVSDLEISYINWPAGDKKCLDDETTVSLDYIVRNNATWQRPEDFLWSCSDETIASISTTGHITFTGKPGEVKFTLTAYNAHIPGKEFSVFSKILNVLEADGTFLYIPDGVKYIEVMKGNDARIYFTFGGNMTNTDFILSLYETLYDGDDIEKGDLIIKETMDKPSGVVSPYIVDKKYLIKTSPRGKYGYIAEVTAKDKPTGRSYTDCAYICVKEPPAKAKLITPQSFYITDESSFMDISFEVENKNADTLWNLSVTKNGGNIYEYDSNMAIKDKHKIDIAKVESDNLLDIYTISLKAKNPFDEVYSFDSYNIYVYNSQALKISSKGNVVNSINIGATKDLSAISREEILDLIKKGNLIKEYEIGIDNKYPWSNISDKIAWHIDEIGEDNISFDFTGSGSPSTFLPGSRFLLRGKSGGYSKITATHIATGMEAELDITVDNIEEKLFLFQAYPAQKCQVSYTNGDNKYKSLETNDKGQVAIYEEKGINSDVIFSPLDTINYNNVVYKYADLMTNQKSMKTFGAHPQNTVKIPPAGYKVTLSLLDYDGDIIIRGGVYRNDRYCPDAKINGKYGYEDQMISSDYIGMGEYVLSFNSTEFMNRYENTLVKPSDKIEYVLEISFPDKDHKPIITKINDSSIKDNRYSRWGVMVYEKPEKIDPLRIQGNVYTVSRVLVIDGEEQPLPDSLPFAKDHDEVFIKTEMLLDFDSHKSKDFEVMVWDKKNDWSLFSQTAVLESYEFSNRVRILNTYNLRKRILYLKPGEKSCLHMRVITKEKDKTTDAQLSEAINIQKLYDIPKMETFVSKYINSVGASIRGTMQLTNTLFGKIDFPNVGDTLDFLRVSSIDTDSIRAEITPTEDPLVYKGVIKFAAGALSKENPSGVFAVDSKGTSETLNYMPGLSDIKAIKKGDYLSKAKKTMVKNQSGASDTAATYGGGAYLECEIYYDVNAKEWKTLLLQSDVYLGAGGGYYRIYNTMVGPIPVTAEFRTGLTGQIGLKVFANKIYDEETEDYTISRDYITELRPYCYIYGFGGFGADYVVASLKVGVYGQIDLDQRYLWLNKENDRNREKLNGQKITVSGETGIKFQASVLFVNYTKKYKIGGISKSWKFNDFDDIEALAQDKMNRSGKMVLLSYGNEGDYLLLQEDGEEAVFESKPYSNPVLTEDGGVMVYTSDMGSDNINDRAICFSKKDSSGDFGEMTEIDSSGFADTDATISGTGNMAVATWVRTMKDVNQNPGEDAALSELHDIMSASEIMAAVYDGMEFHTTRLTYNVTPDLSPVVAAKDNKAIVIWRSAYAGDADNPLVFDGKDDIVYRFYNGIDWSEAKILYEGGNDKVTVYNVSMLKDGTSAIVYQVNSTDSEKSNIYCAIVDSTGNIKNNIRLTHDDREKSNPQITSLKFSDGEERFILGWNSYDLDDGASIEPTLSLTAIDGAGNLYPQFGRDIKNTIGTTYDGFKFIKGANSIEDLSILWSQSGIDSGAALWGKAFSLNSKSDTIESPDIMLFEPLEGEEIDTYDAYIDDEDNINFALLVSKADGSNQEIRMAQISYKNDILIDDIFFCRDELLPGLDIPIVYTIYNSGKNEINEVQIELGDTNHIFEEKINPGEYKEFTVYYNVPVNIKDGNYIVKALYTSSPMVEKTGILKMNVPDVAIGQIKVLEEKDKSRLISVNLYNSVVSPLKSGKHKIKLNIYDNNDFDSVPVLTEIIGDADSLESINNGRFVKYIMLDENIITGLLNSDGEIPSDGARVYIKVVLIEDDEIIEDADIENDWDYIKLQSLLSKYDSPLSIWSVMNSETGNTIIQAEIQNNSMKGIEDVSIIAKLKDEKGKVVASKQKDSVSVNGEGTVILMFNFDKSGTSGEVLYKSETGGYPEQDDPGINEPGKDSGSASKEKASKSGESSPAVPPAGPSDKSDVFFEGRFSDVNKTDWFYEAVKFAYEKGLILGTSEKIFNPDIPATRAMFAAILYRIASNPHLEYADIFSDVKTDAYYGNAAVWAYNCGIVKGINASEFAPDMTISREQIVVMLYRYASFMGYDTSMRFNLKSYKDNDNVSGYALSAMEWAVAAGLIRGTGEYELSPKKHATRAEIAVILQRFIVYVSKNY